MPKHKGPQQSAMFQVSGMGSYGKGVCNSVETVKQGWGEPRECSQTPCSTYSINLQHCLHDPNPQPTHMKAAKRKAWQQVAPIPFLKLDPIAHLIGHPNKAPVTIDGQEVAALIDLGAHVSSISAQLCEDLTLQIQPLGGLLGARGDGGCSHPILRYVEVNLQIPGIKGYNEDVLLLVIPTTTYSKAVPVMLGTKIIDKAPSLMTTGELAKATTTWRQAHFGAVMLGSLQVSCSGSGQHEVTTGAASSIHQGGTVEMQKF